MERIPYAQNVEAVTLDHEKPRFRISAKQNANNLWALDGTAEYKSDKIKRSTNPDDAAIEISEPLGLRLLSLIKGTEKEFRADGRIIAGDV